MISRSTSRVMFLPVAASWLGLGLALALGGARRSASCPALQSWARTAILALVGLPILGLGIGSFIKTMLVYRGDYFAPLSVAGLLHKVKVSNVRPVPARLRGTIIGRGVPGLIWSEDFVMRDGDRDPVPGLPPAAADLGVALRPVPRRRVRGQAGRGRRLVPPRAGAVPRAQVDHRRRRDAQQLCPPRPLRLGGFARFGRCRPDGRRALGGLMMPTLPDSHPARRPYGESPGGNCRVSALGDSYALAIDVHLQESTIVGIR